jgi:hypothetical protein
MIVKTSYSAYCQFLFTCILAKTPLYVSMECSLKPYEDIKSPP